MKINIFKIITFNFVFLLAGITASEFFLRYFYTPKSLVERIEANKFLREIGAIKSLEKLFDKKLYRFIPHSKGIVKHTEYEHSVIHDKYGWRNPCFNENQYIDGLLIGDSFAYGIGVNDLDTIQCKLIKNYSLNYYVISIPGAGPEDYLRMLRKVPFDIKKNKNNFSNKVNFIFFLGNDYEGIENYHLNKKEKELIKSKNIKKNFSKKLSKVNRFLVRNKFLSELHLLHASKLVILKFSRVKDKGKYYETNGATTLYKKNIDFDSDTLNSSLEKFKLDVESLGYKLGKIYLLPDVAEISRDRLDKLSNIGGFSSEMINVNFKFDSFKIACIKNDISCLDTRTFFVESDYYKYDGHFNSKGTDTLVEILNEN